MERMMISTRKIAAALALALLICPAGISSGQARSESQRGEIGAEAGGGDVSELTPQEARSWHGVHPRLFFSQGTIQQLHRRRGQQNKLYDLLLKMADGEMSLKSDEIGQHRERLLRAMPRLALAGVMSGDRRYTSKAIELLGAQLNDTEPLNDAYAARLLGSLAITYDWTYQAMSVQQRRDVARRLSVLGGNFHSLMTHDESLLGQLLRLPNVAGHHRLAEAAGGLGLMALALRGEANLNFVRPAMINCDIAARAYLRDGFGADGAGIEGYETTMSSLEALLPYILARRQMDRVDLGEGSAVGMVASWAAYELASAGRMLPLGESGRGSFVTSASALALLRALSDERQAADWLSGQLCGEDGWEAVEESGSATSADIWHMLYGDVTAKAASPEGKLPLVKFFPSHGMGYGRSGWLGEGGDVLVTFHVPQRAHLGKWQLDVCNFTYEAFGVGWAIDSGPGRQKENGREVLTDRAHSGGHNLPAIDGAGQALPLGRMAAFHDEPDWLIAVGDGSSSYGVKGFRRWLVVGKRQSRVRYVVVIDEIDPGDNGQHVYRHFLHTAAGNKVEMAAGEATISSPGGATARYAVISPQAKELKLSVEDFSQAAGAGGHPRIEIRRSGRGRVVMVSVLVADESGGVGEAGKPGEAGGVGNRGESAGNVGDGVGGAGESAGAEKGRATINVDKTGPAVAFRVTVDGVEDRICFLADDEARPPYGYGSAKHRLQLKSGEAKKALLFDYSESGDGEAPPAAARE